MKSTQAILLVEDDVVDAMTLRRAFKEVGVANPLHVVHNGEEALEYLRIPGQPAPGLILLDLNLPRLNGLELLAEIKRDTTLCRIPVVILSTSREERDRARSFELGVAGYVMKPVDYPKFVEAVRAIHVYWTLSEVPA